LQDIWILPKGFINFFTISFEIYYFYAGQYTTPVSDIGYFYAGQYTTSVSDIGYFYAGQYTTLVIFMLDNMQHWLFLCWTIYNISF
jgi:hypothetical protein